MMDPDQDLKDQDLTDEELLDERERFTRPYDDVFMPDGSLVEPLSVLDDWAL